MGEPQTPIRTVRDRLTGLFAELSVVLKELEEERSRLKELESQAAARDGQLEGLQQRIDGQDALIEALKADAEESSKLRKEVRGKDLEFERVNSELQSKKELIRALRRDVEGVDRLKADAMLKDREIERLKAEVARAERHVEQSAEKLAARTALIESLRADQDRVGALEASLEEKRNVIQELEASINRHASTIAELKLNADEWQRKCEALKGHGSADTSAHPLPAPTGTVETKSDATIAIDMRGSLLEARRTSQGRGEK
ncbi:MAG TPA: hypothetical protein VJA26_13775 [Gammaproteobacteria bacterium]|nr:hypothetical protein [Gammaproteobacteria bacterium]